MPTTRCQAQTNDLCVSPVETQYQCMSPVEKQMDSQRQQVLDEQKFKLDLIEDEDFAKDVDPEEPGLLDYSDVGGKSALIATKIL